ncbi:MAG: restriction endonuclease subunit S [Eubacterium sp.]|nr:restriction endonuclease subunit S [Eubacterium sp.]
MDGVERCIDDEIPFEIPDSWEWARLKTVGITQTGNTPSKTHPEYFGNDIPFIGPGDIQNSNIDYFNHGLSASGKDCGRITPKGSILQVCIGGSIGKAAITLEEVSFNQQINAIIPIILDSEYLHFVMTSPYYVEYMRENAGGTATPIINRGLWDNLLVPIPPEKEQKRIALRIMKTFRNVEKL